MTSRRTGVGRAKLSRFVAGAVIAVTIVIALAAGLALSGCSVPGAGGDGTTTTEAATGTTYGAIWDGDAPAATTETTEEPGEETSAPVSTAGPYTSPAELVAERLGPSVVNIAVEGTVTTGFGRQTYSGEGSGVIVTDDGMIVTNNHVVSQELSNGEFVLADTIVVTLATGEELPARIVGTDPLTDLAVVDVEAQDLPVAEFVEDFSSVRIGQYAFAIGSPLGYENSVTMGIVSGVFRDLPASEAGGSIALVDLIQTDAAISPGNSGGALADAEGRVIGINVAYIPPGFGAENLGFAIPADVVKDVANQIVETGRVRHAFMGIRTRGVTRELQQQFGLSQDRGVLVVSVDPGSPAAAAGMQQGDIIVRFDDRQIDTDSDLFGALRSKRPGDVVTVTVDREGESVTLRVTLAERVQ